MAGIGELLNERTEVNLSSLDVLAGFANAFVLGFLLMLATQFFLRKWDDKDRLTRRRVRALLIAGSSQIFYCVGITALLFLVEKSLVRALIMIAIFTLFRFRVQVTFETFTSSLLFSLVIGLSCGSLKLMLAWVIFGVYILILALLLVKAKFDFYRLKVHKERDKAKVLVEPMSTYTKSL